jgi:beta-lactamase regulating signal transducer with metallopeptidase domain
VTWDGWTESAIVHAAGWAIIHISWQAPVLLALARATADLLGPDRPRGRYAAYIGGLVLVPCLAIATALWIATVWPAAAQARFDRALVADAAALATAPDSAALPLIPAAYEAILPALPWLVLAWAMLALPALLRMLHGLAAARRLARGPAETAPPTWSRQLARIGRLMRVRAPAEIAISGAVSIPSVVGVLRPRILIPPSAAASLHTAELASVLAHELAHVRRRDPLAGILQALIESLFWFHPAVRALGLRVRAEREHCCDDLVVRTVGNPVAYARALTALELLRHGANPLVPAATDGVLLERVRRLLGEAEPRRLRARAPLRATLSAAGLLAGCAMLTGPYRDGAALPASLRPYFGSYTVRATDPAGSFTVSVGAARVIAATLDGAPVPAGRLVQRRDSLHILDGGGGRLLSVGLRPTGGIGWNARPPRPASAISLR